MCISCIGGDDQREAAIELHLANISDDDLDRSLWRSVGRPPDECLGEHLHLIDGDDVVPAGGEVERDAAGSGSQIQHR